MHNDLVEDYYSKFKNTALTFNKDVQMASGLIHKQLFVKCGDSKWPCLVHAASLSRARVIMRLNSAKIDAMQGSESVYVNFAYLGQGNSLAPTALLVPYRLAKTNALVELGRNKYAVTLVNVGKPPPKLILFLGGFLAANSNSARRRETRIPLDDAAVKIMDLRSARTHISVEGARHQCLILDLSFSGSKIIVSGLKGTTCKRAELTLIILDPDDILELPCKILRYEVVESDQQTFSLGLQFDEGVVPMELKMRISRMIKDDR